MSDPDGPEEREAYWNGWYEAASARADIDEQLADEAQDDLRAVLIDITQSQEIGR